MSDDEDRHHSHPHERHRRDRGPQGQTAEPADPMTTRAAAAEASSVTDEEPSDGDQRQWGGARRRECHRVESGERKAGSNQAYDEPEAKNAGVLAGQEESAEEPGDPRDPTVRDEQHGRREPDQGTP